MVIPEAIEHRIEQMLAAPVYGMAPDLKHTALLSLLKDELAYADERNLSFANYVRHWPMDFREAQTIADLPYLPVGIFKTDPPLSLVDSSEIKKTLTSSATTGQVPSRIVLDALTARRMTKGVVSIAQDFIGSARRPYLIADAASSSPAGSELGARGAAIQGFLSFANEITYGLVLDHKGEPKLDMDKMLQFAEAKRGSIAIVYGFTFMLWNYVAKPLLEQGICLNMPKVHILHSGGWKKLQDQAVQKRAFNEGLAQVFGCSPDRIIDFYGMVENVGIIYPDCPEGNKHAPVFGEVVIRDPLSLAPVGPGQQGILQVCSILPTSFPGFLLLTEDLAEVVGFDGCPCGRRGLYFRFLQRIPKAEMRGCGNIEMHRHQDGLIRNSV